MVAAGILLSRIVGLVRQRVLAHYLGNSGAARRLHRRLPHPQPPPESLRRGRALGVVHPRLRPAPGAGDDARRPTGWRAPSARSSPSSWPASSCSGVLASPLLIDRHRAGLRGRQARAHDPARADPLPGRRPARAVGVVPRGAQQPPPVLPLLRRAGGVEPRHHRHAAGAGAAAGHGRPGGRRRVGRVAGSLLQVLVQLPTVRRAGSRAPVPAGHHHAPRPDRAAATSSRRSSGAAWCRSAPTSTRCSRACSRPGAVAGHRLRADALHSAGQPLRHVGLRRRAAGDVGRAGGPRARSQRAPARAARRRAPADRVLRGALRRGLPRARARDRRRALPDRRVPRGRTRCTSGASSPASAVGLLAVDAGPTLLVDVLRAARHAHAAALSPSSGWSSAVALGWFAALRLPGLAGASGREWGAAGLTRVRRDRRLGRVRAAPADARRADRRDRL